MESRLRKKNREAKKAKSFESGSYNSRFDVQYKTKFKKRFSHHVSSNFSENHYDIGFNPKPQKGRNVDPPKERPTCGSVVTNIWVNVLLGLIIAMVVERVAIW